MAGKDYDPDEAVWEDDGDEEAYEEGWATTTKVTGRMTISSMRMTSTTKKSSYSFRPKASPMLALIFRIPHKHPE